MKAMSVQEIAEAVGGRLLCGDPDQKIEHISIDSRHMQGNDLFVPIIGAKVDAHRFIPGAFAAGAAATFTSEQEAMEDARPYIRVADTVRALQALGAYRRKRMNMPVIGITGSVGKTTTREMITAALSAGLRVTGTSGNSNGQLGVPITFCEMDEDAEAAVIEMGMSEPGEMAKIAAIARPRIAVVTNIGLSHIENLGSQENICAEKMHITDGFTPEHAAILNGDDPFLIRYRGKTDYPILFYGMDEACDVRAENVRTENGRTYFTVCMGGEKLEMSLGVPGAHNVMNALAALAAAKLTGVDVRAAAAKLAEFSGFARRLQLRREKGYVLIDDTYNASPVSMKAALQTLSVTETAGRRIAVLADMLELGDNAPRYHYEVGVYGRELAVDEVILVGKLAANIGRAYEEKGIPATYCDGNGDAVRALRACAKPGDAVLFKGSNSMKLGEVIDGLLESAENE